MVFMQFWLNSDHPWECNLNCCEIEKEIMSQSIIAQGKTSRTSPIIMMGFLLCLQLSKAWILFCDLSQDIHLTNNRSQELSSPSHIFWMKILYWFHPVAPSFELYQYLLSDYQVVFSKWKFNSLLRQISLNWQ